MLLLFEYYIHVHSTQLINEVNIIYILKIYRWYEHTFTYLSFYLDLILVNSAGPKFSGG